MGDTPKSKKRAAKGDISPSPKRPKKVNSKATEAAQINKKSSEIHEDKPQDHSKIAKSEVVTNITVKTEINTTEVEVQGTPSSTKKTKRARKTTVKVTEPQEMIRATRTLGSKILVGAHVSAAGGKSFDHHHD
jgi:AP endonuclease-1